MTKHTVRDCSNHADSIASPRLFKPDSIERFIESQAFSRLYDLAPCPPPGPCLHLSWPAKHRRIEKERIYADGRKGEGGGRGAKSYDCKKARASINHSILSSSNRNLVRTVKANKTNGLSSDVKLELDSKLLTTLLLLGPIHCTVLRDSLPRTFWVLMWIRTCFPSHGTVPLKGLCHSNEIFAFWAEI